MKPIYRYFLQNKYGEYLKYIQGSLFYHHKMDYEGFCDYTSFDTYKDANHFRITRLNTPHDFLIVRFVINMEPHKNETIQSTN